jgi:26S proteasome regulatory subunit T6
MALDSFFQNKIGGMKLEIIQGQAKLRRLEAQRNDYNSRVRLLREELGLLQQPGSYVGEVVKVMSTKKVLVKVHPEGKHGRQDELDYARSLIIQLSMWLIVSTLANSPWANE